MRFRFRNIFLTFFSYHSLSFIDSGASSCWKWLAISIHDMFCKLQAIKPNDSAKCSIETNTQWIYIFVFVFYTIKLMLKWKISSLFLPFRDCRFLYIYFAHKEKGERDAIILNPILIWFHFYLFMMVCDEIFNLMFCLFSQFGYVIGTMSTWCRTVVCTMNFFFQ
jgi:hypothetical protein